MTIVHDRHIPINVRVHTRCNRTALSSKRRGHVTHYGLSAKATDWLSWPRTILIWDRAAFPNKSTVKWYFNFTSSVDGWWIAGLGRECRIQRPLYFLDLDTCVSTGIPQSPSVSRVGLRVFASCHSEMTVRINWKRSAWRCRRSVDFPRSWRIGQIIQNCRTLVYYLRVIRFDKINSPACHSHADPGGSIDQATARPMCIIDNFAALFARPLIFCCVKRRRATEHISRVRYPSHRLMNNGINLIRPSASFCNWQATCIALRSFKIRCIRFLACLFMVRSLRHAAN